MDLALLVIVHRCHGADNSQENRHSVPRQGGVGVLEQRVEIEAVPLLRRDEQCRASRTAVMPRYQDAVDVGLDDAGKAAENLGHFGRADVLGFPAVGVAEAVEEEPSAVWGSTEGVAGAVPEIAFREDVASDFLRGGVGVAPVTGKGLLVGDLDHDFPAFFEGLPYSEAHVWISDDFVGCGVDFDGHVDISVDVAKEGAVMPDAIGSIVTSAPVDKAPNSFRTAKEFRHLRHTEAFAESDPHVRSESVAVHASHFVLPLQRVRRRCQ